MNLMLMSLRFCLLLGLLTGCASAPPSGERGTSPELTQWVEKQLIPYVVKQLSQHPKFKDQPFLVVSMKGDNVQPEIDNLTRYIRDQMMGALLKTPGVNPLWRPTTGLWQHHHRLTDLSCGEFSQVRYYIGVDIHRSPLAKTVKVSVRALDIAGKSWVSGFHQSWQGQLNPAQQKALTRRHKDEYLRGLRPFPFTAHQPDLLAAYLAHNLSCLLRHHQTAEKIVIYAQDPTPETRPYFRTAIELVDHYLGRFRKVQVTDNPQQATAILESQVYYLHDNLYQVWVTLRHAQDRHYLPGTKTKAYVHLLELESSPPQKPSSPAQGNETLPSPSPKTPPSSLVTRDFSFEPRYATSPYSGTLIRSRHLRTLPHWTECVTQSRWFNKRWVGLLEDAFANMPCLVVEVSVHHSARLFLVGQNSQGELSGLFPSPCKGIHPTGVHLKGRETFHSPLPIEKIQFLELDKMTGQGRIFAVAIAAPRVDEVLDIYVRPLVARKLRHSASHYASLIAKQLGLCNNKGLQRASPAAWLRHLNALAAKSGGRLEWKGIELGHNRYSKQ